MNKFNKAYVITGTIGSGKSSFCNILKELGYDVIDADKIGHLILDESTKDISEIFSKEFIKDDKVDRTKLGELVFNNKNELEKLENFIHPKIMDRVYLECKKNELKNKPYFVEISVFFEKCGDKRFKNVVVVYAPDEILFDRISKRNNLTKEQIQARLDKQIDMKTKRKMADYVIDNSKDFDNLKEQAKMFLNQINKDMQ
ncbi:dephospho-CoA kinase [Campylobacter pinnipediorum subsp. caledonicus]|uniref:dephospho-CoA kinase n=1 Tax=Campylobacter pinnipediorum TaxID=1965231 RepID=UPI000995B8BA|nr:dephospho-CoA kinase [Campylobacter pinnipediorum]OPA72479.1 dephospho-CoA kinase [Campylobacter pinnipediorum subsp. caledonicus]